MISHIRHFLSLNGVHALYTYKASRKKLLTKPEHLIIMWRVRWQPSLCNWPHSVFGTARIKCGELQGLCICRESVCPSVRPSHSCRRYRSLAGQHTAANTGSATMSAYVVSEQKTLLHCVLCRSLLRVCSLNFCFPFWVDAMLLFVAKWRYSNGPGRKKTRKTCADNWSRVGARMEVVVGNYNVNNTEHIT